LAKRTVLHAHLFPHLPDDVEDGRHEQLIVDGHGHVARLVESRGDGADGAAEVHPPQQEQELRWDIKETNKRSQEDQKTDFKFVSSLIASFSVFHLVSLINSLYPPQKYFKI